MSTNFALFDSAIGTCGIIWREAGIAGLQLPEGSRGATRARLRKRFPDAREAAPPASVREAVAAIVALLSGEGTDLADIQLDMEGVPAFHSRAYAIARKIQPGSTSTYGEIAAELGEPGAARAVGQAMGRNPFPIIVPCHRVLAAGGRTGGFSAHGGRELKLRMLAIEGVRPSGMADLFDARSVA